MQHTGCYVHSWFQIHNPNDEKPTPLSRRCSFVFLDGSTPHLTLPSQNVLQRCQTRGCLVPKPVGQITCRNQCQSWKPFAVSLGHPLRSVSKDGTWNGLICFCNAKLLGITLFVSELNQVCSEVFWFKHMGCSGKFTQWNQFSIIANQLQVRSLHPGTFDTLQGEILCVFHNSFHHIVECWETSLCIRDTCQAQEWLSLTDGTWILRFDCLKNEPILIRNKKTCSRVPPHSPFCLLNPKSIRFFRIYSTNRSEPWQGTAMEASLQQFCDKWQLDVDAQNFLRWLWDWDGVTNPVKTIVFGCFRLYRYTRLMCLPWKR